MVVFALNGWKLIESRSEKMKSILIDKNFQSNTQNYQIRVCNRIEKIFTEPCLSLLYPGLTKN